MAVSVCYTPGDIYARALFTQEVRSKGTQRRPTVLRSGLTSTGIGRSENNTSGNANPRRASASMTRHTSRTSATDQDGTSPDTHV